MNASQARRLILYIGVSLDGYIARDDGAIDWLTPYEGGEEDYGYREFMRGIDTVVMGRATYELCLTFEEWPYPEQDSVVLTHHGPEPGETLPPRVAFSSADPASLLGDLRKSGGRDIWLVGGARTVHGFEEAGLIDEYIISVIPILLGSGLRLFRRGLPERRLSLTAMASFPSGIVQMSYGRADAPTPSSPANIGVSNDGREAPG